MCTLFPQSGPWRQALWCLIQAVGVGKCGGTCVLHRLLLGKKKKKQLKFHKGYEVSIDNGLPEVQGGQAKPMK